MKKAFLLSFLILSIAANAQQKDINIQVEELNVADTAFNFHPTHMLIRELGLNATYDSMHLFFETTLLHETKTGLYQYRDAFIRGEVLMPLSIYKKAFPQPGTIDSTVAQMIFFPFKLKYIPPTPIIQDSTTTQ